MPRVSKKEKSTESARLSRDDWLDAAFEAVVEHGFDGARVLTLAGKLGVTRGSFYWHFKDHSELIEALIDRWHAAELATTHELARQASGSARSDLLGMLDTALARGIGDLKDMRFELALRGLGRRDVAVAKRLVEVDETRMEAFEAKFQLLTGDSARATELAVLFYLAITGGVQALSRPASSARHAEYIKSVIAKQLIAEK